jgi:hypothetical protein
MRSFVSLLLLSAAAACGHHAPAVVDDHPKQVTKAPAELRDPREVHFASLKQLTFGGENAEAYWSNDGTELTFQSTREPYKCDQIFRLPITATDDKPTLESTGKGRTTCSYFFPGDRRVLYSSTERGGDDCPPEPDRSKGYVWAIYDSYDIYTQKLDGSDRMRLTETPGYDAEATICPSTGEIVFTSMRDGDLDLYKMNADGTNVVRLTNTPGYDGGAFFSPDCKQIVWRASRPKAGKELDDYQALLKTGLVRPTQLELYVANADGSDAKQITYLGAASFAPYWFPSGKRIIFSSNYGDPKGREFDIWAIDTDGTHLERITYTGGFDGFPMFSPDGTMLSFSSNRVQREGGGGHETNLYLAKWIDAPDGVKYETGAADRFMDDVKWLADDAREGRGVGTKGLDASADWLVEQYGKIGVGEGVKGFKQAFDVTTGVDMDTGSDAAIDGKAVAKDGWGTVGYSGQGSVSGDVVVAGYGVTASDLAVDDYKKISAKGKIVVVRRFTSQTGRFEDDRLQRRYGDIRWKAWNAREHGAKALVVVDFPEAQKGQPLPEEAPLPALAVDSHGDAGIPVIVLTRGAGKGLFSGRHKMKLDVALKFTKSPAYNIVGTIKAGAKDKLQGAIVIGAHYDHLGMGGPSSLAPGVTAVHNGADDNASGTAALLEVARVLEAHKSELRRDVWIVAFSGEEWGVLGSSAFVKSPPAGLEISDVIAMFNMDMVGRMRANHLSVLGTESAAEWAELVPPACDRARLDCTTGGDGYGPSDHISFYTANVPVLFFFTGAHDDYHKPSDDADKILASGGAEIAGLVADLATQVDNHEAKLTFKASPAPDSGGDVRSYGASLGTIPDYTADPKDQSGVLLAGVRPGGPADQAGIKKGDRLVKIGSHDVHNVEDFMFVLRNSKPGDTTTATVVRDGKQVDVKVTFGKSHGR